MKRRLIKISIVFLVVSFISVPFLWKLNDYLNEKLIDKSSMQTYGQYLNVIRDEVRENHAGGPISVPSCYSLIYFTVNGKIYESKNNFIKLPYGGIFKVKYNKNCPRFNKVILPDSLLKYQSSKINYCVECYGREIGKSPENYIKLGNSLPFNWVYLFYD